MKELAAINKMLDAIFAYGSSRKKKKARKIKKGPRSKNINCK
jgi:hypothetical protein